MEDYMYVFEDLYTGKRVIFSDKEKSDIFMKEYGSQYFSGYSSFPKESEDYTFEVVPVNLTYYEWKLQ